VRLILLFLLAAVLAAAGQDAPVKDRVKDVRAAEKEGAAAMARLSAWLDDPAPEIRREAARAIVAIGTLGSLEPLTRAARDADLEVQIRAIDGLVNFYIPGYVDQSLSAQLKKAGTVLGLKMTDRSAFSVDPGLAIRPEVESALNEVIATSPNLMVRAAAVRAAGSLRSRVALPRIIEVLRSKDDTLIYEALIAIQKIGEVSSGHRIVFLLRDLNERVQGAAMETAGVLRTKEAVTDLTRLAEQAASLRERRGALASLAMISQPASRDLFERYFADKDENLRGSAAEGLGRLAQASDLPRFQTAFDGERKMGPRLALAYGCAMMGDLDMGEFKPLRYLVNTLNNKTWKPVSQAYLQELARRPDVRARLSDALGLGTREERLALLQLLGRSGGKELIPRLETLARDPDAEIAQESLRALRILRGRSM
jgi:HEAT repeat protein